MSKKAVLIVSFGTTYPETRKKNIEGITRQVRLLYPDVLVQEAVSSTIVRTAMREKEHLDAKSPAEGLEALLMQGATDVVVFPTHVIDGIENHRMKEVVTQYQEQFENMEVAAALLAEPKDYKNVAKALWESLKDEVGDAPLILMGHGTEHAADSSYTVMEQALRAYAEHEIYIATVEGSVTIDDVIARLQKCREESSPKRVVVTPFMLVAGDHANNDMVDTFAEKLRQAGYEPECLLRGIGEYPAVVEVYLSHLRDAMSHLFCREKKGKACETAVLYGIGVGPGDPKLMTLQALEIIQNCDRIVLPAVSKEECYAYRITRQVYPEIAQKPLLCMPFPMIRDAKKLELAHTRIYEAIEDFLKQGQKVGMLTIGDPSVYSTYLYMHRRAQAAGWKVQMISGVPSFCATAARLGIPLGEKQQEIHILPAAYDIAESMLLSGTRVYMKSGKKLQELLAALRIQETKQPFEVYGVSNCGMENEHVYYGLDELAQATGYLTTVIVKDNG